jgi:hypothetical protein
MTLKKAGAAIKLASVLLVVFCAEGQAQSIHDLFGTETFHRAYFDTRKNELTFEPFHDVKWEAKARQALTWLNLDQPTPAQIARLSTSEGAGPALRFIDFNAPLDPKISRADYLLLYDSGIVPIDPVQLRGSAQLRLDPAMKTVEERTYSGTVVGRPAHRLTSAAFVVIGKPADVGDVNPRARFQRRNQAGPAVFDFIEGQYALQWTAPSKDCPGGATAATRQCLDAASALSFRLGGERLVLVKWKGDEICEASYTLFLLERVLKPIAGNAYHCDI